MSMSSLPVSILVTFFLLYIQSSAIQAAQAEDELCPVQVREHYLTQRPTRTQVIVGSQCNQRQNFLHCEGEFRGAYQWTKENGDNNYVLLDLSQKTLLAKINLTYMVEVGSERPKISFCAVPDNISIEDSFTNMKCREITVQPTGDTVVGTLESPFINETSKIAMEVITQGIKAAFRATRIEFFGSCAITTTAATQSSQFTAARSASEQTNTQRENATVESISAGNSVLNRKKTLLSSLLIAFGVSLILLPKGL